jgi:hypothetical protein
MLRVERAVSYAPAVSYVPLDANTAHLVLYADSDPARRAELTEAFGEVLDGLKQFDESEVAVAQKEVREHWMGSVAPPQAERVLLEVNRAAVDWLFGREFKPVEHLQAQNQSVTPGDLEAFARDVQRTLILTIPGEAPVQPWIGDPLHAPTVPVVQGRGIPRVDARIHRERLVHGPEGVSLVWPDGSHMTVRYSELAAAVHYDDGCVVLVGLDAESVAIEPTFWPDGKWVCHKIRDRAPAHLLLDLGSRPTGNIPKPPSAWQRVLSWLFHR